MILYKKNILALIFLCLFSIVSGTTYYVSSTGNDAANGITESTSWKSITKVNSAFSTFKPGDKVLFKRGDTFYGSLTVTVSGTSGNPIIIGAYGTGNNPVLSGFTILTGWTNQGNGIWSKAVVCSSNPNILLLDGVNTPMGRSPIGNMVGGGWPSNSPHMDAATSSSLTDSELSSYPSLVGAEVVIRTAEWVDERKTISGHSGSTISYSSTSYTPPSHNGISPCYFIQNDISTLNLYGEWCYRNGNIYMYFGSEVPTNHTIKVPILDVLTNLNGYDYITFDGLSFQGSNKIALNYPGSSYITVQKCDISFNGADGVYANNCDHSTVTNNTFDNNNNVSVYFQADGWNSYTTITYNTITNNGMVLGQGGGDGKGATNENYEGIVCDNMYSTISYNRIIDGGGMGIRWGGEGSKVTYNYIDHVLQNVMDAGAIYSYRFIDSYTEQNKECAYNIIVNIVNCKYGWVYEAPYGSVGVYLDGACYANIHHNTFGNIEGRAVYVNCNNHNTIEYNTIYNVRYGIWITSSSDVIPWFKGTTFSGLARNHVIRYNTVVTNTMTTPSGTNYLTLLLSRVGESDSDLPNFGTINYNYYASVGRSDKYMAAWYNNFSTFTEFNIVKMRSNYGYDANSTLSSTAVTDVKRVRFEYNATNQNKIVALDAGYIDVKGTKYSGNITLLPYTSVILLPDPNSSAAPAPAPVSPVYVSSAVENATPSLVEMTYNLTLANIVPVASAFSVKVNAVARPVSRVVISGTKVQLSLAIPVAMGESVTVSYTKPANNPIQTPAGGQAATISSPQTVTNRVSSSTNLGYMNSVVGNSKPSVLEITYNLTLANIMPSASAFSVIVNSTARTVNAVAISGNIVELTLATEVVYGDVVTVAYNKPASYPLQSSSGLLAGTMSAQSVTNKVASVGPVYVSSSVENSTPGTLEITYNETLDPAIPGTSAFVVMVNGVKREVTAVSISGNKVILTLASPVVYGNVITVSYIRPSSNELKKATGESAVSFSLPQPVTNKLVNISVKKGDISVYPNPAREFVNISIPELSIERQIIRIFDLSGKLCLEKISEPLTSNIHIPIRLQSGVYILQVIMGSITSFTQKIIVSD